MWNHLLAPHFEEEWEIQILIIILQLEAWYGDKRIISKTETILDNHKSELFDLQMSFLFLDFLTTYLHILEESILFPLIFSVNSKYKLTFILLLPQKLIWQ